MTEHTPALEPNQASLPLVGFTVRPIGIARPAPCRRPRVPKYFSPRRKASLELFQPYRPGLLGLCEGMDIWVVTLHAPSGEPFPSPDEGREGVPGIFATQNLHRPNPIEFLRAKVLAVDLEQGCLTVEGLEVQGQVPMLDIRPATSPHHGLL